MWLPEAEVESGHRSTIMDVATAIQKGSRYALRRHLHNGTEKRWAIEQR
jgi:hypothetical protein